ncbi:hypothetical protein CEXT_597041 [Caerostris extrusa]|uniref:Uncharacterized protein n=1 Tax=Caerostris extrusa TaxID=172846 RepID=A0AAV4XHL0_CAEEX|nr:hypothetical protein CEXT_597041 [Caerostris extrusa]
MSNRPLTLMLTSKHPSIFSTHLITIPPNDTNQTTFCVTNVPPLPNDPSGGGGSLISGCTSHSRRCPSLAHPATPSPGQDPLYRCVPDPGNMKGAVEHTEGISWKCRLSKDKKKMSFIVLVLVGVGICPVDTAFVATLKQPTKGTKFSCKTTNFAKQSKPLEPEALLPKRVFTKRNNLEGGDSLAASIIPAAQSLLTNHRDGDENMKQNNCFWPNGYFRLPKKGVCIESVESGHRSAFVITFSAPYPHPYTLQQRSSRKLGSERVQDSFIARN